jgi:hypothetical protein
MKVAAKKNLQKIDELYLPQHTQLGATDECYFLFEYAGRKGPNYSLHNQLIYNFKKFMSRKDQADFHYKEKAILEIARIFISTPVWEKIKFSTWVIVPSSKMKSHPEYDDRLLKTLQCMKSLFSPLDIREMLFAQVDREPASLANKHNKQRPTVDDHLNNWKIEEALKAPAPGSIIIFDDVITTGASYKAAKIILERHYVKVPIFGIFIARDIRIE